MSSSKSYVLPPPAARERGEDARPSQPSPTSGGTPLIIGFVAKRRSTLRSCHCPCAQECRRSRRRLQGSGSSESGWRCRLTERFGSCPGLSHSHSSPPCHAAEFLY